MALYPQFTAQGSANRGLLERSLLHLPDPFVSKADAATDWIRLEQESGLSCNLACELGSEDREWE